MSLPDEDLALLSSYVDGSIDDEEQLFRFEERLSREPELARALDAAYRVDWLASSVHAKPRQRRGIVHRLSDGRFLIPLVAAAAAVMALIWFDPWKEPSPGWRVAALATGPTLLENNLELGLQGDDRRKVPAGLLRGGPDEGVLEVPLREYVELVEPAMRSRVQGALDGSPGAVEAEYFVLPVRTEQPSSAIVLILNSSHEFLDAEGLSGRIAWPDDRPWKAETGRLEAGEHVLPRPPILEGATAVYHPGFLVPLGSEAILVLIGLRDDLLGGGLERELEAAIQSANGTPDADARIGSFLRERGFDVQVLTITERTP